MYTYQLIIVSLNIRVSFLRAGIALLREIASRVSGLTASRSRDLPRRAWAVACVSLTLHARTKEQVHPDNLTPALGQSGKPLFALKLAW